MSVSAASETCSDIPRRDDSRFSCYSRRTALGSLPSIKTTDSPSLSWTCEFDSTSRATHRAQELFIEACGALYNDILDAADLDQEVSEEVFQQRQMEIASQGAQLSEAVPQLSNMISHKLSTVNRAMEHLKIRRRSPAEGCTNEDRELSALSQLRKWIHMTNEKLGKIEANFSKKAVARKKLDRLAADQQVLQLQIETEGQTLVQNVERSVNRKVEGCVGETSTNWDLRRQRHLKALTQRWHDLWLRSLSVQYRIEKEIEGFYQSEQDWESDPELREPLTKRRRTIEGTITEASSDDPLRSEEDTIPFAEDEYERIVEASMLHTQSGSIVEAAPSEKEDIEPQPDIGYSSGENSFHEALNEIADVTTEMNASDCERRMRIESSPVKSFYRTVPLDDTGATDTETPRICITKWPTKFTNDVLTDSLIVNTEDEHDIVTGNDIKEILSMLDDEENGNLQSEQFQEQMDVLKQGTRWCEFKSGRRHSFKPPSHDNLLAINGKNSCDASSEESDDMPGDVPNLSVSMSESQFNSLKRRYRGRSTTHEHITTYSGLRNSSVGAISKDMETSMFSNSSQPQSDVMCMSEVMTQSFTLTPTVSGIRNRRIIRRKLRARRLPRSMSDGEQLGTWMNASTYSAPPSATAYQSTPLRDSDATTAPEHSDAPPYEWDDYNPPAKVEDGWGIEERQDASLLTLEDDFQMHLGEDVRSLIAESRASLRSAESIINRQPSPQSLEDLRTLAKANSERLTATVVANPRIRIECLNDIDDVSKGWNTVLSTIDSLASPLSCETTSIEQEQHDNKEPVSCLESPLSAILSKIEKFASSLKLIQDDDNSSTSSICSLSPIRSFDDVVNALRIFTEIHDRLVEEREELKCILDSASFSGDLSDLIDDFKRLSMGYEDAIGRVEHFMSQIEKIRENWSDWAETQGNLQSVMSGIEKELAELRKGGNNSKQICSELEMCQERMNRLETVCNYLTSNLSVFHDNSSSSPPFDFTSELAIYSNALEQLKARFEQTLRSSSMSDKSTWVNVRKRHLVQTTDSSTNTLEVGRLRGVLFGNWAVQALVVLTVMAVFTAWLVSTDNRIVSNWRGSIGPRLDYVDGPPPM
uniref:Nuclear migration protein unc-83 n=1 Tax=Ascaris suum TaxID=6253 RepID=F1KQQ1_ASCSU